MKILVVHAYYQQPGGEDECFRDEVAMLRRHGHDVVTYEQHNDDVRDLGRVTLAARTIWSRHSYEEVGRIIAATRPDVMHCHNTFPLISPAVYYIAQRLGVPVVQTLHNYRLLCPNALLFRDQKPCENCVNKVIPWSGIAHKCYRGSRMLTLGTSTMLAVHRGLGTWRHHVDMFLALSQFSRRKFIEGGLPPERIRVKPNFLSDDPGIGTGGGRYAIFVGRLSPEKGLATLLRAWSQVRERLALKIVGDGPLMTLKESIEPGGPVEFLGRQPVARVLELIKNAELLIAPSECYENFPRTVVEAFACGTPVVASNIGAFVELIENGRTGLKFSSGDAGDLAEKVICLSSDAERLQGMRRTARREYEMKYTADTNYRRLIDAYEESRGHASLARA